ncbi:MAG: undecaprenyl-phosphate glucose phosphotransferase [Flavobacteriaceae bacterium]|nr:undecaprenyl-phosphate glucose phosphotransferase [Flavobacteriaceae bacterium]
MSNKNKRYSIYIKPISIITNLAIINLILYFFLDIIYSGFWHITYTNLSWLIISYHLNFYNFKRFNKYVDVLSRLFLQFIIFTFVYFAYYSLTNKTIEAKEHLKILSYIFFLIILFRTIYLFALKKYREEGGNFRNIILIGTNKSIQKTYDFLNEHPELGYNIMGYFSDKKTDYNNYLGSIESSFDFTIENGVDEIYCSISDLTKNQIKKFVDFADNNLIVLKLIPDAKDVFTTKMVVEYYDYQPILSLRKIPFDEPINQILKRFFDILFSLFIIVFILSWLTPLLFLLVKKESKGPLLFKQTRDGLNGETFKCYKFRSMVINELSEDIQATKEDIRVTKIGRFLRKTSMDELPQFYNVLKGEMSIVGPRPHMLSQTKKYAKIVDKFMVRHFVKPGITGLAQVRGYRGEVEKNEDMENRVKLDIFYLENWSFILDLKIIGQTIINVFKGEDKAY